MRHAGPKLALAALAAAAGANAQEAPPGAWEGVWVAEGDFGPRLDGPVSLHRLDNGWLAQVQGESAVVRRTRQDDGTVHWAFSMLDQGRFAGVQRPGGAAIAGHWLQPPGAIQGYPIATPVSLTPAGDDAFVGVLRPARQTVSLNIPLVPDRDGASDGASDGADRYRTFLRNPERNLGVWFRIESAVADGDALRFFDGDGQTLAVARSVEPGERFTLRFPRFGTTFDFTRRSREDAPGFYPRRDPKARVTLIRPAAVGDGWQTAAPTTSGLAAAPLKRLLRELSSTEPTQLREPYIHGLLLAHRGKLVVEEYFHGYHRERTHDSRSAGKSLASILLGIAIENGAVGSVDLPVYPFFGGVEAYANPDPRKARLTLRHLITMSPGFACNDGDYDSPGNEDVMQNQSDQPDWYRYALDLPMRAEPGEADIYCSAGINLVGGVISRATGQSLAQFFHHELATPLDMGYYQMNLSPTEEGYMGGGIRLTPRDFLKLGQLYLDGGEWRGRRLVSESWVRDSAAAHSSLNSADDYGFGWWRTTYRVGEEAIDTFYASGNGGQLLFIVPTLELVALIQAGNYSDGRTRNAFRDRFMQDAILPAALAAARKN